MGKLRNSLSTDPVPVNAKQRSGSDYVIALAGNPNTGKSTIFNALTGLKQHTGNWPGKTVLRGEGRYTYAGKNYLLIDLPGTYSLFANSVEEQVARDFICFGQADATVVVTDANCLERNLNLVLQVLEITSKVVVCVNLLDEAERHGLAVNLPALERELGVPVVGTVARAGEGLHLLQATVAQMAQGAIKTQPRTIVYDEEIEAAIEKLLPHLEGELAAGLNLRWLALRLLEGDQSLFNHPEGRAVVKKLEPKLVWLEG